MCDEYLGRLDDPSFHWDGGDENGNVPTRLSPFFPPAPGGYQPFRKVIDRIQSGVYDGKQTDWGAWVARVTPLQVLTLIDEVYGGGAAEVRQYLQGLDPTSLVALVAAEL